MSRPVVPGPVRGTTGTGGEGGSGYVDRAGESAVGRRFVEPEAEDPVGMGTDDLRGEPGHRRWLVGKCFGVTADLDPLPRCRRAGSAAIRSAAADGGGPRPSGILARLSR